MKHVQQLWIELSVLLLSLWWFMRLLWGEILIWGVINKQCVLWRNVSSVFGNNKSNCGRGKSHCLFCYFIFLFHICLFTSRRDSDQSLITEDGLQTWFNDFKQALQVSMNKVRTVYDLCCGLILYLSNPGLNLPTGVWTLLSFCIRTVQLPNFMTLIQLHVLLAVFQTAHSVAMKTIPHKRLLFSL